MEFYDFPILSDHIGNAIIPTDELIFFKMVIAPPTSYGKSPFLLEKSTTNVSFSTAMLVTTRT